MHRGSTETIPQGTGGAGGSIVTCVAFTCDTHLELGHVNFRACTLRTKMRNSDETLIHRSTSFPRSDDKRSWNFTTPARYNNYHVTTITILPLAEDKSADRGE